MQGVAGTMVMTAVMTVESDETTDAMTGETGTTETIDVMTAADGPDPGALK